MKPCCFHQPQHDLLARDGEVGVGEGVVDAGGLRQTGQQGAFGQEQVGGRLAEIGLRGGLDAVGHAAVIDLVEVQGQDFVLGVAPRSAPRPAPPRAVCGAGKARCVHPGSAAGCAPPAG